jgi:hypothetical protein
MNRPLVLLLALATPSLALASPQATSHTVTKSGDGGHRTTGQPTTTRPTGGFHPYRGPVRLSGGTSYLVLDRPGYYREGAYAASPGPGGPLPGLALELGVGTRHLAASGEQLTSDNALATQLRLLGSLRHGFYVGLEGEAGTVMDTTMAQAPRTSMYGYAALLGVMERSNGFGLGVEVAAGGRSYEGTPSEFSSTGSSTTTIGVVEARVRGEMALSPTLSLGAMVGSSVIDRGDWTAGAYLSMHTTAFSRL